MARFVNLEGLRHFKEKILEVVQSMIDASSSDDADRVTAIQQYVSLYNGFMGTDLNWRDYSHCTTAEITKALDDMSKGFGI